MASSYGAHVTKISISTIELLVLIKTAETNGNSTPDSTMVESLREIIVYVL